MATSATSASTRLASLSSSRWCAAPIACARKTLPLPVCARHTDAAAVGHDRSECIGSRDRPMQAAPSPGPAELPWRAQDWLREAELKHCRVCMLATVRALPSAKPPACACCRAASPRPHAAMHSAQVGFAFTDFYHLPGFDYTTLEAHDACVASGAMSQLLLWIGALRRVGLGVGRGANRSACADSTARVPRRFARGRLHHQDRPDAARLWVGARRLRL